jgi:alanine racemase
MTMRPSWAEISLSQLAENYRFLRSIAGTDTELLTIVKADAYGHGLRICAPALATAGAQWMGVTSVEEGVALRQLCPEQRVLLMSGIWREQAAEMLQHRLTPIVWEPFHLDELETAARAAGLPPQSLAVHLELDTGMSRQGVPLDGHQLESFLLRLGPQSPLQLEGVMTHFSSADELQGGAMERQFSLLKEGLHRIIAGGHRPQWLHAGATATLTGGTHLNDLRSLAQSAGARLMLRPGLALYGYLPRFEPQAPPLLAIAAAACRPILQWKTRVISLRTIPAGQSVGYNETFVASEATRIALVPLGYADGLNRLLSNRFSLLVRGQRAPIAGRISMDHAMLDVTDIPDVEIGEEVAVIGHQDGESITAYDHADAAGTIPWEILCDIGSRIPRVPV